MNLKEYTDHLAGREGPVLILRVDTANAAFDPDPAPELARILRGAAHDIETGTVFKVLKDVNGNAVGEFRVADGRVAG